MRKMWVCLFGVVALVGISAAPAVATPVALFSSSAPGVAASPPAVPAGICAVTITAEGGRGGMYDGFTDAAGAAGAAVTARVPVDPGAILNILVGGVGGTGGGDDGSLTGDGGVGGGGGGGIGAAGGGGASVVWLSTPTALVVAGAGGGANPGHPGGTGGLLGQSGGDGATNGIGGVGPRSGKGGKADGSGGAGGGGSLDYAGGGGGGVGAGGAAGDNSPPNRDGGPGGTGNGVVGGGGGSGGGNGSNGTAGGSPPGAGSGGTSSLAGDGGAGVSPGGNAGTAPAQGSGGGGGGIGFGGGGGAGSGPAGGSAGGGAGYGGGGGASGDGGGGGGGGSSYVTPSALSSSSAASTRSGDGQVTITYDPVADACPDTTDPTVDLRTPPAGTTYALGQVVKADFACADEPGGSGLASCVGNVADGAAIDTSTTGAHELTVTATDAAGNETAVTHGYTVTAVACAPGYFSATGNEPCAATPPGYYVDSPSATSPTACAPGSYQPSSGQTSCVLAAKGYYVDTQGATGQTACPSGSTTTVTGASACVLVNQVPSFTKGPDKVVLANTSAQTFTGWATAISPGPASESGQRLDFIVTNDTNPLFSAQPSVDVDGTLHFTPAANQTGVATVSVQLRDDGGTDAGGVDTSAVQQFTITVNQAPSFAPDTSPPLTASVGQPYGYPLVATGYPAAITYTLVGAPAWLTIDANGVVGGNPPTGTKTFTYSVKATNTAGNATAGPYTVTVATPPPASSKADVSTTLSCPTSAKIGVNTTCTLTVRNAGPATAKNVWTALALPSSLTKVSNTGTAVWWRNIATWKIASLNANATSTFTITFKGRTTGKATLGTATASTSPDPNWKNNITSASITLTK